MDKPKTVWIFAGEASGDQYGARIARELRAIDPAVVIRGMGSHRMAAAGVDIMVDSSELGVIGIIEVLKHLRTFLRIFKTLVDRARQERPDAVVLIDYPGFNIRFAKQMHKLGIKVVWYVSPQVWAWGKRRIPKLARIVNRMLCLFPFEPKIYEGTGLRAEFVGHPLLEILADERDASLQRDPNTILLLPGSRRSEIDRLLFPIIDTALILKRENPQLKFALPAPRQAIADYIRQKARHREADLRELGLEITIGDTHRWMQKATAGLAASGTVTVEAAMLGLPLVVVYRIHPVSYWILRMLVKVPYFTMVNLICNRCVFEEFLQGEVTVANLSRALRDILPGGGRRQLVEQGMADMVAALGGQGHVCRHAALAVFETIANPDSRPRK
jgi:lipid-A-disaccharide synthase